MLLRLNFLALADDPSVSLVVVLPVLAFVFIAVLLCFGFFFLIGRHWLAAFLSGRPVSVVQLMGMALRRSDIKTIIDQGAVAFHAGHPVDYSLLEVASREGLDLETVTSAYCVSQENEQDFTFKEIMDAARESRLEELLAG